MEKDTNKEVEKYKIKNMKQPKKNLLKKYNQKVQKHNDSIKKVANQKFPIFKNKDKSESKDRAASINFSRLQGAERFINKNKKKKKTTLKPSIVERVRNFFN
jgi:hypothetical protein|tara:strand:- start:357 stop:662 length:306 start_codon:yes stop_codon:yes gene_type:complete